MLQATGRTVIMTTHLLHGLWTPDHGLALWVEQVEGHKIVLPEQVPAGTFPPIVEAELAAKSFRHRLHAALQTPRGRMVTEKAYTHLGLAVPAAANPTGQNGMLF